MVRDDSRGDAAGDEPNPTVPAGERDDPACPTHDVTLILSRIEQGDGHAAEQLLPLVYEELRKLAAAKMAQEKPDQTLQATALVHEAYIRLVDVKKVQHWDSRGHFFAAAAEAMRRILIQEVRRNRAQDAAAESATWNWPRRSWPQEAPRSISSPSVMRSTCLAAEDPAAAALAKVRIFAGLSVDEAGVALGMPHTTAYRQWIYAQAWLRARLRDAE